MPLYTYVVIFEGKSFIAQGRHSNFKGFVNSWSSDIPENALPGFSASLKNQLIKKVWTEFESVPNRQSVWKKTIELDGKRFEVIAVETRG